MWLRSYLMSGQQRPIWAFVLDDLLATVAVKRSCPSDKRLRQNTFTQHWKPSRNATPGSAKGMLETAAKYGLKQEGLAFPRNVMRQQIMWGHAQTAEASMRRAMRTSAAVRCLTKNHQAYTVGDFEAFTDPLKWTRHVSAGNKCACSTCEDQIVSKQCAHPEKCRAKALEMLSLLPTKWDPRESHPEDYEDVVMTNAEIRHDHEGTLFDRKVTAGSTMADTFRIFTDDERLSAERPDMRVEEQATSLTVGTDGSCAKNGEKEARAGAGVYIGEGDERNVAIRLPRSLKQSNQTAEIAAIGLAAQNID
ncbi:hypothetical protein PYCCODRAFT_1339213, partial [Trametes coccinea BRFM310]